MQKRYTFAVFAFLLGMSFSQAQKIRTATPQSADKTPPVGSTWDPTKIYPSGDQTPPVITCLNGLSVNLMPTGLITLWSSDFLLYAEDNITPADQIRIGIRKAGTGSGFPWDPNGQPNTPIISVTYDCGEQGTQNIELWAMDAAGNTSHCESPVIVQDNFSNCDGNPGLGTLCVEQYCDHQPLEEASLNITGSSPFVPPFSFFDLSGQNGCFDVPDFQIAPTFNLSLVKDDNPLNGVTSYDLVLLSNHIHGIQPFTEPWQWVAADANRDNVIDLQDSIEFRKLITGTYSELPNNTSWRFVRSDYVFPSPNPLSQPIPESILVGELSDSTSFKFYGIKIGNLNCGEPRPVAPQTAGRNEPPKDPTIVDPPTDHSAPTVTCLNGLNVNIMPTGLIQLWATDFLAHVTDDVTPLNRLRFGIRKAGTGSGFPWNSNWQPNGSLFYDCDEQGAQTVEVWVMDEAGNAGFCQTTLVVQDNAGNCSSTPGLIEVCVKSGPDCFVEEVSYVLAGVDSLGVPFYMTSNDACAHFNVPLGSSGTIMPVKDDNPLNGVTTYDWVLIRKHINGLETFSTPYKYIAADINRDGQLNLQDSVDLYGVILGIYQEFPHNVSMRFIPDNYVFQSPADPLSEPFPEFYTFSNIQEQLSVNFTPIKTGDVNSTFVCNTMGNSGNEDRRDTSAGARQELAPTLFPNPTGTGASISLWLQKADRVRLYVRDLSGKLMFSTEKNLPEGTQLLEIPETALPHSGLYFWNVLVDDVTTSGKVIRL